jgi:hypothetical protein
VRIVVKVELKTDVELNDSELRVSDNSLTMSVRTKTDTDSEGRDSSVESDHKFDLNTYIGCREVGDKERLFCKWSDCHYESNQRTSISRHILNRHLKGKDMISSYDESNYWEKILNSNKSWLKRSSHKKSVETREPDPPLPEPPVLTPFDSELTSHELNEAFLDDNQWLEKITSMALPSIIAQKSGYSLDNSELNDNDSNDDSDVQKQHLNISNNEENVLLSCKGLVSIGVCGMN